MSVQETSRTCSHSLCLSLAGHADAAASMCLALFIFSYSNWNLCVYCSNSNSNTKVSLLCSRAHTHFRFHLRLHELNNSLDKMKNFVNYRWIDLFLFWICCFFFSSFLLYIYCVRPCLTRLNAWAFRFIGTTRNERTFYMRSKLSHELNRTEP